MRKAFTKPNRSVKPIPAARPQVAGTTWQIQTAKARFSEVFRLARSKGDCWRQTQSVKAKHYQRLTGCWQRLHFTTI